MKFNLYYLSTFWKISLNKITYRDKTPLHFQSIFHIAFTFEINSVTSVEDLVTNVTEESDHRTLGSKKYSV